MNRAKLEEGFGQLIVIQRYIAATGAAMNVRKIQTELSQAMDIIAAGCNDGADEDVQSVKTEWQKRREEIWLRALEAVIAVRGTFSDADGALMEFEKRFGPKKKEEVAPS